MILLDRQVFLEIFKVLVFRLCLHFKLNIKVATGFSSFGFGSGLGWVWFRISKNIWLWFGSGFCDNVSVGSALF